MARLNPSPIRMYRGTTAQHSQYAGPIGELTVDTDKNTVVVQNGTDGGVPLAQERRQVIAGDGITVNGGASGTLASDITVAVDQTWIAQHAPAGPEGPTGPAGADGAPGAAATIAVGSVTTGAAGTQASVTNSGTANAAVLNFTIPQGAKGDKGDTGATGPAGAYTEGTGISISSDSISVDQTWLDNYIDGLVNGGNLVTAGDGVDVTASDGVAEIAVDDTVVRTTYNQEINGNKTFRALTYFYGIQLHDSNKIDIVLDFNRGVSPSYFTYSGFTVDSLDSKNLGYCRVGVETDGTVAASLAALQNISGTAGLALISVRYPQTGSPYAIAPSTRATPEDKEIITFDFLENYVTEHADNSVYLPLYFQVGTTEEIHTFLPAGVTTVRRANFEADGAGTGSLTLTMARDIGATTSMTVGSSATDCSAYAGHAVMFTISGTSNQTEVAAMLVFE